MKWNLLKGFEGKKYKVDFNGKLLDVVVTVQWSYEDYLPGEEDIDFGSYKANKTYLRKFEDGILENVCISVIARGCGVEGIATLGSRHIKTLDFENNVWDLVRDESLINEAIDDLKENIKIAILELEQYK